MRHRRPDRKVRCALWRNRQPLVVDFRRSQRRRIQLKRRISTVHAVADGTLEQFLTQTGKALQDGLEKRGYELIAPVTNRLPELTTVWVPSGVDDAFVRRALLERYGIEIGGGVGPMAGKAWRIGCMGHTARLRNVAALLAALDEVVTW